MSLAQQLKDAVQSELAPLTGGLTMSLKTLTGFAYPPQVKALEFETTSQTLVDTFLDADDSLPVCELIAEAIIVWFAACWQASAAPAFALEARIALHDSSKCFDLRGQRWTPRF